MAEGCLAAFPACEKPDRQSARRPSAVGGGQPVDPAQYASPAEGCSCPAWWFRLSAPRGVAH